MTWLNFEDPRLALYEICFPNEFAETITSDMCEFMRLPFSHERLLQKLNNNSTPGAHCVYIEQSGESRAFLLLDCTNIDWLYTLCVICDESLHPFVKDRLLAWDHYCREKYGQPRLGNFVLQNKIRQPHSLFRQIIERHQIGT